MARASQMAKIAPVAPVPISVVVAPSLPGTVREAVAVRTLVPSTSPAATDRFSRASSSPCVLVTDDSQVNNTLRTPPRSAASGDAISSPQHSPDAQVTATARGNRWRAQISTESSGKGTGKLYLGRFSSQAAAEQAADAALSTLATPRPSSAKSSRPSTASSLGRRSSSASAHGELSGAKTPASMPVATSAKFSHQPLLPWAIPTQSRCEHKAVEHVDTRPGDAAHDHRSLSPVVIVQVTRVSSEQLVVLPTPPARLMHGIAPLISHGVGVRSRRRIHRQASRTRTLTAKASATATQPESVTASATATLPDNVKSPRSQRLEWKWRVDVSPVNEADATGSSGGDWTILVTGGAGGNWAAASYTSHMMKEYPADSRLQRPPPSPSISAARPSRSSPITTSQRPISAPMTLSDGETVSGRSVASAAAVDPGTNPSRPISATRRKLSVLTLPFAVLPFPTTTTTTTTTEESSVLWILPAGIALCATAPDSQRSPLLVPATRLEPHHTIGSAIGGGRRRAEQRRARLDALKDQAASQTVAASTTESVSRTRMNGLAAARWQPCLRVNLTSRLALLPRATTSAVSSPASLPMEAVEGQPARATSDDSRSIQLQAASLLAGRWFSEDAETVIQLSRTPDGSLCLGWRGPISSLQACILMMHSLIPSLSAE